MRYAFRAGKNNVLYVNNNSVNVNNNVLGKKYQKKISANKKKEECGRLSELVEIHSTILRLLAADSRGMHGDTHTHTV